MTPIRTGALLIAIAALVAATAGPAQLTAPLGSTKGSFIDGSQIYGSAD
jgi:hypothetical protein